MANPFSALNSGQIDQLFGGAQNEAQMMALYNAIQQSGGTLTPQALAAHNWMSNKFGGSQGLNKVINYWNEANASVRPQFDATTGEFVYNDPRWDFDRANHTEGLWNFARSGVDMGQGLPAQRQAYSVWGNLTNGSAPSPGGAVRGNPPSPGNPGGRMGINPVRPQFPFTDYVSPALTGGGTIPPPGKGQFPPEGRNFSGQTKPTFNSPMLATTSMQNTGIQNQTQTPYQATQYRTPRSPTWGHWGRFWK